MNTVVIVEESNESLYQSRQNRGQPHMSSIMGTVDTIY